MGGALTDTAFRTLRWRGRDLVLGFAEGAIQALEASLPLLKGASPVGVDLRQFREREPVAAQRRLQDTVVLFTRGALAPPVAQVFAVAPSAQAVSAAGERTTVGPW